MPERDVGGEGKAAEEETNAIALSEAGKRIEPVAAYLREEPDRGDSERQPVEAGSERCKVRESRKDRGKSNCNAGTQQSQESQRRGARRRLMSNCHEG